MRCEPIDAPIGARAPVELACRMCGCTDDQACVDKNGLGCSWISIDPPLCSACVSAEDLSEFASGADAQSAAGESGFYGAERCPASKTPALHVPLYVDATSGYCARCRQGFLT